MLGSERLGQRAGTFGVYIALVQLRSEEVTLPRLLGWYLPLLLQ